MSYPEHQGLRPQYGPEQTTGSHAVDSRQVLLSSSELSPNLAYSARYTASNSYQMRRERFDYISSNRAAPVQHQSPFHHELPASHVQEPHFKMEWQEYSKSGATAYEESHRQQSRGGQENCNTQSYSHGGQLVHREQNSYETKVCHEENETYNKIDCSGYREANRYEEPPNQYGSGCGFYKDREPSQYAHGYDFREDREPDQYVGGYGFYEDGEPAQYVSGCGFNEDGEPHHGFAGCEYEYYCEGEDGYEGEDVYEYEFDY